MANERLIISSFTFDPTNQSANLNIYKEIQTVGVVPSLNINVPFAFDQAETVAEIQRHAATAVIKLLREVIETLEKQ